MSSPEILWRPWPKQAEFLAASEYEVLYGGALGGGKTDALIIDALGLNRRMPDGSVQHAINHPKYRALLWRRSYKEMHQLLGRCRKFYEPFGAVWRETKRVFLFPSGAEIEMGYAENLDDARSKYKGAEYQWFGVEELTEHPTDAIYQYLKTRVRGPDDIPRYIRATTNPDGPGHYWVKDRFRIPDSGAEVPAFVADDRVGRARRFIPARLKDNPSLAGDYETDLLDLSYQQQQALLHGRWDSPDLEGTIYRIQYQQAQEEGRICAVPIEQGHPVNTFWDLGANDAMAIWFHQRIGFQDRFCDYYENRHQPLAHYVQELQRKGYVWGRHYLPHDGDHNRVGAHDNRSIKQMLEDLGLRDIVIVPRISNIKDGIEQTRQRFSTASFDKERCAQGLRCLQFYRWRYDARTGTPQQQPLHDWTSNGADAFRQWAQGFNPNRKTWRQLKEEHEREAMHGSTRRSVKRSSVIDPNTDWVV